MTEQKMLAIGESIDRLITVDVPARGQQSAHTSRVRYVSGAQGRVYSENARPPV